MDLRDFELLVVLARTRNITHAAEELFLTQSGLSKRLSAIEQELGFTIALRSKKGIQLTPEGENVVQHASKIIEEYHLIKGQLSQSTPDKLTGTIRVGISTNFAHYHLPDILKQFKETYPGVTYQIFSGHSRDVFEKLEKGEIDLAIIRGDYDWNQMKVVIKEEPLYAIFSTEEDADKLPDTAYIEHYTDSNLTRNIHKWLFKHVPTYRKSNIVVDQIETCVLLVESGLGWTIVPEVCLSLFKGIRREITGLTRKTILLSNDISLQLPQVKVFFDLVVQSMKEK